MDFLPVCDLLFNLVSVTAYFCDVAFAAIVAYSLLVDERDLTWFFIVFLCTTASLLFCQILSLRWFVAEEEKEEDEGNADSKVTSTSNPPSDKTRPCSASWPWLVSVGVHFCMCGVLWRYARLLFLPIDMALVKREMRNLSILRMVHAFTQCLPCILAEGYLLATRGAMQSAASSATAPMASPTVYRVASALALLNICWALASFSKHIRRRDIHRLTLTWIGVICQLLWHLGTVGARCLALVLYASVYHGWIFLFGLLHWTCMLMWIIFQSKTKEAVSSRPASGIIKTSVLLSYGYMVDFINLDDSSDPSSVTGGTTRFRMTLYYGIMAIENLLLVSLWSSSVQTSLLYAYEDRRDAFLAVILPFLAGLFFMAIYYRVFHVTRTMPFYLGQDYNAKQQKSPQQAPTSIYGSSGNGAATSVSCGTAAQNGDNKTTVFNCALNPAMKKRKKIPRVIPPPPPAVLSSVGETDSKPFWKQPLPQPLTERKALNGGLPDVTSSVRMKLEDKRRNEERQLRSLQVGGEGDATRGEEVEEDDDFISLPNGTTTLAMGSNYGVSSAQHVQNPFDGSLGRTYAQPFHGHDSSGDQGDIDSAEDVDWPRPLQQPPSLNPFNLKQSHSHFPPHFTNASNANGARAETQL